MMEMMGVPPSGSSVMRIEGAGAVPRWLEKHTLRRSWLITGALAALRSWSPARCSRVAAQGSTTTALPTTTSTTTALSTLKVLDFSCDEASSKTELLLQSII